MHCVPQLTVAFKTNAQKRNPHPSRRECGEMNMNEDIEKKLRNRIHRLERALRRLVNKVDNSLNGTSQKEISDQPILRDLVAATKHAEKVLQTP
jgi:hypothetical protein